MSGTPDESLGPSPDRSAADGQEDAADNPTADDWIAERLHKTYDEVLAEPLPESMLELLDALASKERRDK